MKFAGLLLLLANVAAAESVFVERFEDGLDRWSPSPVEKIQIVAEPEMENSVLQLTPNPDSFAHVLLKKQPDSSRVRVEGRFLFPTEGDGYLGFIYNYQQTEDRMDFGVIYVKSNGSYIRISPHFDGNPSWRLHEQARFDLLNNRKLEVGVWYPFRLDVSGHQASLAIGDLDQPLVTFSGAPTGEGQVGLEARPGRGEPVWVDDIVVSSLTGPPASSEFVEHPDWQFAGPFEADNEVDLTVPSLESVQWQAVPTDPRGMLTTGLLTQYRSGKKRWVYLRYRFNMDEGQPGPTWLAASSANRLDVWFNGYFRGVVPPEQFIWTDYLVNPDRPGARLPLAPSVGENEIIIRVHGERFAGGGMFLSVLRPDS